MFMNERIEELVDQCYHQYSEYNIDLEKFAELIIRECLFIIDDERKPEMASRVELWKKIKEHFGVD